MDRLKPCPAEFADAVEFSSYQLPSLGQGWFRMVASTPDCPGAEVSRKYYRSDIGEDILKGALITALWVQHPSAWETEKSYADAPQSISELRADRERMGTHLTSRDPAIMFLRDLDAGKLPHAEFVTIMWRNRFPEPKEDGTTLTVEYIAQSKDVHTSIGLLQDVQNHMVKNAT